MTASSRYRIGFDIGGTFTDFILLDTQRNEIRLHKCLTTPQDPSVGALEGLAELLRAAQLTLADIGDVVHGTTLVTNALIERSGARLGLITTRGFRDILEMGTEQRYDIYDLFLRFPDPLVPRRHRLEVAERMDRDGNALTPLDPNEARAAAHRLVADGIEAIAICFLHAYRNPAHEQQAAADRQGRFPRHRRVDLIRRRGGTVGIPALQHHLRQRLRAAADGTLHREAGARTARARLSR